MRHPPQEADAISGGFIARIAIGVVVTMVGSSAPSRKTTIRAARVMRFSRSVTTGAGCAVMPCRSPLQGW